MLFPIFGLDYGLYYAWAYASLFATEDWPRTEPEVQQGMATYRELLQGVSELAQQANQPHLLRQLQAPAATASPQGWQGCADQIYAIMQKRDLVHDWQFTKEQISQLNDYFYANELLVQCLNVAVVSDRQAILAGLLAPPQVDKETRA